MNITAAYTIRAGRPCRLGIESSRFSTTVASDVHYLAISIPAPRTKILQTNGSLIGKARATKVDASAECCSFTRVDVTIAGAWYVHKAAYMDGHVLVWTCG